MFAKNKDRSAVDKNFDSAQKQKNRPLKTEHTSRVSEEGEVVGKNAVG